MKRFLFSMLKSPIRILHWGYIIRMPNGVSCAWAHLYDDYRKAYDAYVGSIFTYLSFVTDNGGFIGEVKKDVGSGIKVASQMMNNKLATHGVSLYIDIFPWDGQGNLDERYVPIHSSEKDSFVHPILDPTSQKWTGGFFIAESMSERFVWDGGKLQDILLERGWPPNLLLLKE